MSDRQLIADLLSALEYHTEQTRPIEFSRVAIEAAREYLRKPVQQQEPVAWADMNVRDRDAGLSWRPGYFHTHPLYTSPPASKLWVGLPMDEFKYIASKYILSAEAGLEYFQEEIEAKLREKNA